MAVASSIMDRINNRWFTVVSVIFAARIHKITIVTQPIFRNTTIPGSGHSHLARRTIHANEQIMYVELKR